MSFEGPIEERDIEITFEKKWFGRFVFKGKGNIKALFAAIDKLRGK